MQNQGTYEKINRRDDREVAKGIVGDEDQQHLGLSVGAGRAQPDMEL